jgi:ElaA protein
MSGSEPVVRGAHLSDVPSRALYRILALRTDVFVVEQQCVYRELDGRDLEPGARLLWIEVVAGAGEDDVQVLATLRMLDEPDGSVRLGRVATAATARGRGLAAALVSDALRRAGSRPVRLAAQTQLVGWYERWGFARDGEDFLDDGIPHTPMRRDVPGGAAGHAG